MRRVHFFRSTIVVLLLTTPAWSQDAKPLVIAGELTAKDPFDKVRKESHHKVHELKLKAGEIYLIDLRSPDFDTFLRLEDTDGTIILDNDDISDTDLNSRLGFVPKKSATYRAIVTSFPKGETGKYTLRLGGLKKVDEPKVIAGKLTDKSQRTKEGNLFDVHKHEFKAGQFWLIDLMSKEFDPLLHVGSPRKKAIANDDDGGDGLNSRVVLPIAESGEHYFQASALEPGTKGDYTLRLQRLEPTTPVEVAKEDPLRKQVDELNQQGIKQYKTGQFKEALETMLRVLELREQQYPKSKFPKGHSDIADGLNSVGYMHRLLEEHVKSEPYFKRAFEIERQLRGDKHPTTLKMLIRLGEVYMLQEDFVRAAPIYQQALEIRRETLGENHPDFANSLNNLAGVYRRLDDRAKAEPLFRQAIAIKKRVFGENHPAYGFSLHNLAELLQDQGDDAAAEPLYLKSIDIRRDLPEGKSPEFAGTLDALGQLYQARGDYAKAEPLYKQAMEIFGEKHWRYTSNMNNLATIYMRQADYAKAERLLLEVVKIRQRNGEDEPLYATSLGNLAEVYAAQGEFAKAEQSCKQALAIVRKVRGEKHADTALSLNNLARIYLAQDKNAEAEPLLDQAIKLTRETSGAKTSLYATCLSNLATMYQEKGDHAKAGPLLKEAADIFKQTHGEKNPDYAGGLYNLARHYNAVGNHALAESTARQAVLILRANLEASALVQSERQQIARRVKEDLFLRAYLDYTLHIPTASAATYDLLLSWKGSVTTRQRLTRLARTDLAKDSAAMALFADLDRLSGQIAALGTRSADQIPKGIDLPKKLTDLAAERETVEAKLSARTEGYRKLKQSTKLSAAELQNHLPDGALLVDFVEYLDQLSAFVVTRDKIHRVEFGLTKPIADAVEKFRLTLKRPTPLMGKDDPARELREKLLDPLEPHLSKAKLVLIAPEGALCQLPFGALPSKGGKSFLIEQVPIAILPVPQMLPELLASGAADAVPSLLVVGDVDFDADVARPAKTGPTETSRILELSAERTGQKHQWRRLPGTVGELEAIEKLFRAAMPKGTLTSLRGVHAADSAFRAKAPGHDYLHLATHGFFAPKEIRKLHVAAREQEAVVGHPPGLLSGLVFAGANRGGEGVLTALEVGELDLTKVRLAVLSACETGLGETGGGEGVLGLQRAFQVAGAKTVVTTLWSIPDEPTRVLMERFYENQWSKKMGKLAALVEAQQWMLREGRSDAGVARGVQRLERTPEPVTTGRLPPYYWAAFVLSGDWR